MTEPLNPYLPYPARIARTWAETEDESLRSYWLSFDRPEDAAAFAFTPGQFAELSLAGYGEIPIGIASSPAEGPDLLFTVNRVGVVTTRLHELGQGDAVFVRGPLGHGYPLAAMKGKNILIVAGGFAVTTLRATMHHLLASRGDYGRITFVYGARTPGMLLYREDLAAWEKRGDVEMFVTVDREAPGWTGITGFVPAVVERAAPSPDQAIALVCGPPVMIKYTQPVLDKLGWGADQIYLSLENRMKCGLGICGRCNVGPWYVCKDGPVFTKAELDRLPKEY
jgi:NAD(P)H-flavin reductase